MQETNDVTVYLHHKIKKNLGSFDCLKKEFQYPYTLKRMKLFVCSRLNADAVDGRVNNFVRI